MNRTTKPSFDKTALHSWIVLIVDDIADNLMVASTALKYQGAQVYTASDGIEGLAMLREIKPTFVLLDLSMPHMDGWQMFQQMRSSPELATIPVIALSAHAMEGDKVRAKALGFDGYITKPFDVVSFADQIRAIVEHIVSV